MTDSKGSEYEWVSLRTLLRPKINVKFWANDNDSARFWNSALWYYESSKLKICRFVLLPKERGCNDLYILWFLGDLMRDLWQLWFHEIIMIAAFFRRLPRIIAVLAWHSSQLPHWICMSSYIFVCYKKSWNFWSKLFLIDNSIWQSFGISGFNSGKSLKSESHCNIDIRHVWIWF